MSHKSASTTPDMDKSREQLLSELRELRAQVTILKESEVKSEAAVEALRESEERFRALADNIPNLAWMADVSGGIFWFNKQWYDYTGTKPDEMRGWGWLKVHHPDHVKAVVEAWSAHIKEGKPHEMTSPIRGKDGKYRWFLTRVTPIRDEQGNIQRWFGTNTDITERKQAEEALRESQALLSAVIDGTPEPIFIKDRQSRLLMANPATLRVIGKPLEEVIGKDDREHYADPAVGEALIANDRRIMESGKAEAVEEVGLTPNGYRTFISTKTPYRNSKGEVIGILGVSQDITERRRAEEALRESEFHLARAQEIAHLGSWAWDVGKDRIYWSDETYRLFGLQPGEIEPKYSDSLSFIHPGDRERVDKAVQEALVHGRYNAEFRIVRKDGGERYAHGEGDVTFDNDGNPVKMEGTVQDITERKRAEQEMKVAKLQAELYLDLMGHDINNMHQVALGYLEMAKDMPPGAEQAAFLDKPVEVLQRSTKLIDNVRKLQKLRDGVFQSQEIDVCKVLADIRSEYEAVTGKNITLSMDAYGHCYVRANELLHDVYANLVNNAVKHTEDGAEITVSLDTVEDNGRRYYRVAVEDNGPGIPDDNKEKIFNRMHMGSAKGMGLGLYLVRTLVNSYEGRVLVEDRVKGVHTKGARFVVMLPAVEK